MNMQKGCHEVSPPSSNSHAILKGTTTCLNLDNFEIFMRFISHKKKVPGLVLWKNNGQAFLIVFIIFKI